LIGGGSMPWAIKALQKKNEDTYPVFFKESNKASRQAAEVIAPFLIDLINPRSVIDIGCDNGEWLVILKQLGVEKVLGIDSPGFELRRFLLETKEFFALDLRNHFVLPNKFDLALCLEVAEHIPQKRAETFIEDLCRIAPVTLFSAAVPGQGGTEHINLQWPEYWERIFNKNGFIKLDPIRPGHWLGCIS
jgi:SAM-dependent methyltransferase